MKFNNFEELVSYIVKFFESRNIKDGIELKNLTTSIATTLYILFNSSLEIPESKLKLILSLVCVAYSTGKNIELFKQYKHSFK